MKIEAPTEIIEEGEIPEAPKKRGLSKIEYDFMELRADFLELREKIAEKVAELAYSVKNLNNRVNSQGNKTINGYSVKEIAQLKALGIKPQDILRGLTSDSYEEKEKKQDDDSPMSKMQRDNNS